MLILSKNIARMTNNFFLIQISFESVTAAIVGTLRKNLGILLLKKMGYRLQSHYGGIVKLLLKK